MFAFSRLENVDLSGLDMIGVGNTQALFIESNIKTVLAKSETDASILRSSSARPAGLQVIVK